MFYFVHFLGFALWLGGGVAVMALAIRAGRDSAATRTALFRILPAAYNVMALGAALTLLSGFVLALRLVRIGLGGRLGEPGITIMMASGVLGAIMVMAIALPASRHLATMASNETVATDLERVRKRLAISGSVAGVLGLISLMGVTLVR